MLKKYLVIYINFAIIFLFLFTGVLQASAPYSLTATDIEYNYGQKEVYARGEVEFISEDIEIRAEKLSIDIENTLAVADEEVILSSREEEIRGTHLEYNYSLGTGTIYGAESEFDSLNFHGRVIEITAGEDYRYSIENAEFTPCILPDPHYQYKAEKIKIYPGEKITGEKISFWWGQKKIFQLPYYVLIYTEDGRLENSVPLPELGFNSKQGLIITFDYPYQLNDYSRGNILVAMSQTGDKEAKIDNIYNFKKNLTLQTLYNYDKVIEDDESENIEEILAGILRYNINKNYGIRSEFRYEKETKDNNTETDKLIAAGINYSGGDISIDTLAGYNFSREQRQEELLLRYDINNYSQAEVSGLFYNEAPEQYAYRFSGSEPLRWEIIYRDGYDLDYHPYLELNLPKYFGINTDLGLGRVTEDDITVDKVRTNLSFNKNYNFNRGLSLNFRGNYILNFYLGEGKKYQALTTDVGTNYSYKLSEKNNLTMGISWLKTVTEGSYLLTNDEIEEKETIKSELMLEVLTPQPQSAWIIKNSNNYNLPAEEWEDIELGVIRKFDCYSLQVNYNFVDNSYEFSLNL